MDEGSEPADRGDVLVLSSGRTVDANCGIVGIDAVGSVHHGYDGEVSTDDWSDSERAELARLMVDRWSAFGRL